MTIIQLVVAAIALPAIVAVTAVAPSPSKATPTGAHVLSDSEKETKAREFIKQRVKAAFVALEDVEDLSIKMISRCPSGYHAFAKNQDNYLEEDIYGVVVYHDGCSQEQICRFHANPYTDVAELRSGLELVYRSVDTWLEMHADELADANNG